MKPVIKNILVPTDYSVTALRAAKIAAAVAKKWMQNFISCIHMDCLLLELLKEL
ncbi:MAG: hypothetical protein IPM77_16075 [Crocinitomicaceae bacterium]|nr:hypothetical protein [Crocinitomicaceae bacterium]